MFRYGRVSRREEEEEEEEEGKQEQRSQSLSPPPPACSLAALLRCAHCLLLLALAGGVVFQSLLLHRTDARFRSELRGLEQSLREQLAVQRQSENISSDQVLGEVQRLRTDLAATKQQVTLQNLETKSQVADKLDTTLLQLDVAIRDAKADIKTDVEQVRSDMSSYISSTDLALKAENDFIKFEIAGTFTLLACLISAYNIWSHLRHFAKPSIQRRILAILLMVPVYSVTSWLSLVLASAEPFLSAFRDCYEAYIVYTFMAMLVEILGNNNGPNAAVLVLSNQIQQDKQALEDLVELLVREDEEAANNGSVVEDSDEEVDPNQLLLSLEMTLPETITTPDTDNHDHRRHSSNDLNSSSPSLGRSRSSGDIMDRAAASASLHDVKPPCPCSYDAHSPRSTAAAILYQCQILAMQFVFLKPVLAALPFFLELSGVAYTSHPLLTSRNHLDWSSPKLYVYGVLNISVTLAFYGLMKFYQATAAQLAWCDPWPKFLTVKVIVFMTFWQGIAITGMSVLGVVDEQSGMAAQNILICIEMLLASLTHHLFFPYREWQEGYKKEKDVGLSHLRDTLVLRDFVKDVHGMLNQHVWEGVSPSGPKSSSPLSTNKGLEGLAAAGSSFAAGIQSHKANVETALKETVRWLRAGENDRSSCLTTASGRDLGPRGSDSLANNDSELQVMGRGNSIASGDIERL